MADKDTQPGAQQEYHTVGGLSQHLLRNDMVNQPIIDDDVVEEITQPTPQTPQETVPEPTPLPQATQGESYPYTKPDGTEGTFVLPTDPAEKAKAIASLASGKDAYLLNREIVKEQNPELAAQMYKLMQNQTGILEKMSEQQVQQKQEEDPTSVLTEQQKGYYMHLADNGDEEGAKAYLASSYATNMMVYNALEKVDALEKNHQQSQIAPVIERNVNKIRELDPSLPEAGYTKEQGEVFYNKFMQGYGGFLRKNGFSDQQIFYGNIDHDTQHKVYDMTANSNTQQAQVRPGLTNSAATANTTTVSPDVLKTMQDVSGGQSRSAIGNEPEFSKLSKASNRRDMRALDRDGSVSESFLGGLGGDLMDYVNRRRAGKPSE